jgi:hypothetical protein
VSSSVAISELVSILGVWQARLVIPRSPHHHHHHRNDNDQQNVFVTWSVLLIIGNPLPLIVLSSQQHWPDRMAQETLSKKGSKFIR